MKYDGYDLGGAAYPQDRAGKWAIVDVVAPIGEWAGSYIHLDLHSPVWGLDPVPNLLLSKCLRSMYHDKPDMDWDAIARNIDATLLPGGVIGLHDDAWYHEQLLQALRKLHPGTDFEYQEQEDRVWHDRKKHIHPSAWGDWDCFTLVDGLAVPTRAEWDSITRPYTNEHEYIEWRKPQ